MNKTVRKCNNKQFGRESPKRRRTNEQRRFESVQVLMNGCQCYDTFKGWRTINIGTVNIDCSWHCFHSSNLHVFHVSCFFENNHFPPFNTISIIWCHMCISPFVRRSHKTFPTLNFFDLFLFVFETIFRNQFSRSFKVALCFFFSHIFCIETIILSDQVFEFKWTPAHSYKRFLSFFLTCTLTMIIYKNEFPVNGIF